MVEGSIAGVPPAFFIAVAPLLFAFFIAVVTPAATTMDAEDEDADDVAVGWSFFFITDDGAADDVVAGWSVSVATELETVEVEEVAAVAVEEVAAVAVDSELLPLPFLPFLLPLLILPFFPPFFPPFPPFPLPFVASPLLLTCGGLRSPPPVFLLFGSACSSNGGGESSTADSLDVSKSSPSAARSLCLLAESRASRSS